MKNKAALFLLPVLIGCLAAAQGGEFWQKKDYKQWTERECRKLLEDSPWVKKYTLSQTFITPLQDSGQIGGQVSGRDNPQDRERQANPRIVYKIQFSSAQPIRQATVRMQQITQKYDQMTPEQKQAFDQEAEKYLSARFSDAVVLHISFETTVQQDDRDLARHWQTQTIETLKNFVFLIGAKGEKVAPERYTAAGGGRAFQLVFPRQYEGRPLATAQDKTLKLEFIHPRLREQREQRVLIEFKVDKMVMQGEAVY